VGYNSITDNTGHLAVVACHICEIRRNSEKNSEDTLGYTRTGL